jgi:hypothetical protein
MATRGLPGEEEQWILPTVERAGSVLNSVRQALVVRVRPIDRVLSVAGDLLFKALTSRDPQVIKTSLYRFNVGFTPSRRNRRRTAPGTAYDANKHRKGWPTHGRSPPVR